MRIRSSSSVNLLARIPSFIISEAAPKFPNHRAKMVQFLCTVLILLQAVATRSATVVTLPIVSYKAVTGKLSTQNVTVLSTKDLTGTTDNWDKYIEVSAGTKTLFNAQFDFQLKNPDSYKPIQEIKVLTNTIGAPYANQQRTFFIRNAAKNAWETIGNNKDAKSWVWFEKNMSIVGTELRPYFNSSGVISVQFVSNNKYDVSNVDLLTIQITSGSTPAPVAPKPTAKPTKKPTAKPVVQPTGKPTRKPTAKPASTPTARPKTIWQPKATDHVTFQLQLQGTLNTTLNVKMYDIDLFDTSAQTIKQLKDAGHVVVCYFSAGSYEGWRPDWPVYFPFITTTSYTGNEKPFAGKMAGWDERWLDIREIALLEPIMRGRLQMAVDKGCDAVDPDNMDAYTNSETLLPLTYQDQLNYNIWMANLAHSYGLSVGLKNDLNQLADLVNYYDWALNEQCFFYDECGLYNTTFLAKNKAVFGVEYDLSPDVFCPKANKMNMSFLKKNLDLLAYRIGCETYPY